MNIATLFARIGIKAEDSQVKRFASSMKMAKGTLIGVTAAAAGVSLAIKKITTDAMASAVAFKQFEVETGASAQSLQKWQSVAEQTNQSAESVTSAIKSLVANQEKIKLGQGNISGFQMLGIDPRQDPFKILEELRVKTKGLTDGMKKNILAQIGVGAGLLQTLNLTREQFDAMSAKAFIISPQAIETLNKTKASVDLAGRAIKYIKAQIAVGLAPQMKKLTTQFTEFIKVNEEAIIEGFKKGFTFVRKFTTAIMNAGKMINNIIVDTLGWENAIKALIGVFVLLNATLLLSPIGLITAGIILLVAVMEDLYVYSKGGKSLFGVMMKEFPALKKTFEGVMGPINDFIDLMKAFSVGDELAVDKILKDWEGLGTAIKTVLEIIAKYKEWRGDAKYDEETGDPLNLQAFEDRRKEYLEKVYKDPMGMYYSGAGGEVNQTVTNYFNFKIDGVLATVGEMFDQAGEFVQGKVNQFTGWFGKKDGD